MSNTNKRMKIGVCAGIFGATTAYLLDAYIQMTVSNTGLHFMFGYMDGMIVMALIMIYIKHHRSPSVAGGN